MKIFLLCFLLVTTTYSGTTTAHLNTFETDYCTMFVEGTKKDPELWKDCCVVHDLRYWFGGSEKDQDLADERLKSCVENRAGSFIANLMYRAVRMGHYSPVKFKYQWSWGWITPRQKTSLSSEEKELVISELKKVNLPKDMPKDTIDEFIKLNFPDVIGER